MAHDLHNRNVLVNKKLNQWLKWKYKKEVLKFGIFQHNTVVYITTDGHSGTVRFKKTAGIWKIEEIEELKKINLGSDEND